MPTAATPQITPPYGFQEVVALAKTHRVLLPRGPTLPVVFRTMNPIPVSYTEFPIASHDYPLVFITADEGKTWTQPTRLVTTLSADCGYPSTVQRADGKLVTAWYSKASEDHNRYQMGVAVWDVPRLLGRELSSR